MGFADWDIRKSESWRARAFEVSGNGIRFVSYAAEFFWMRQIGMVQDEVAVGAAWAGDARLGRSELTGTV